MTKSIRKVVSIICVIAILMSLCVVSMFNTTSAFKASDEPVGGTLLLDFENNTGASGTSMSGTFKNEIYYTDPADADNTVIKLSSTSMSAANFEVGKADADTLDGSEAYKLLPDTTYKFSINYKFAKGSYIANNRMNINLYRGAGALVFGKVKLGEGPVYTVDPALNPETAIVDTPNKTVNVLSADTQWFTYTLTFKTPADLEGKDRLYVNMPNGPQTAPFGNFTTYVDNVKLDIVDELEDPFEYLTYDFKNSATGAYYDPQDHNVISNNGADKGNLSRPSENGDGYIFSVNRSNGASNKPEWRFKMFLFDDDHGGFLRHTAGYKYFYTVHYKVIDIPAATSLAVFGIGRTDSNNTAPTQSQMVTYFDNAWNSHTPADIGKSFTVSGVFECPAANEGAYATIISGGNDKMNVYLVEKVDITVITDTSRATFVKFETGAGHPIDDTIYTVGSPTTKLPIAIHDDPDTAFAGWFLDEACTIPVGEKFEAGNITVYAKWHSDFAWITLNNSGTIETVKLAKGVTLANPTRPNSKMFFEGWYTDLEFTEKVTVAPDYNCTLYAKYNYTYIPFNNGGFSDASQGNTGIITDPDDANNKVLYLYTAKGSANNFEFANYDAANAEAYKLLKLKTKYYFEFKIKIPAGTVKGTISLMTGGQSAYSQDASKSGTGTNFSFSAQPSDKNSEWTTVSGYYTTGDSWYRERINFTVQNKIYLSLGLNEGVSNSHNGGVYLDDFFFGEISDEVPAGAVGVYYKTNSTDIPVSFGYAGEELVLPEAPTLGGHEFVGWYSDCSLLTPFTGTTFPTENTTLYAKWKPIPLTYDLTNFQTTAMSERYNYLEDEKGNRYLEYNYPQANTSGPGGLARFIINDGKQYQVTEGVEYTIKFKYNLREVNQAGSFCAVTHDNWSTWGNSTQQTNPFTYNASEVGKGWLEGSVTFVATCKTASSTYLSLAISGDSILWVDDVTVICSGGTTANIYGSTVIKFDAQGGEAIDPVSGNPGDPIKLPAPKRAGFKFGGWYTDATFATKFTQATYGEEDILVYAKWVLGKFTEGYEEFPSAAMMGVAAAYEIYNKDNSDVVFDAANVHSGNTSVFRNGTKAGTKGFTLCRETGLTLGKGEQYTVTFYVKPTNVTNAAGVINLVQMSSNTAVNIPDTVQAITDVGSLKVGEWQQVSYTFTADQQYIGITTTEGNDIYFDSFTVTLKGYTGTTTGDNSVSPIIVMAMVILSAGALVVIGKKIFA